jgi:hypothetical protein
MDRRLLRSLLLVLALLASQWGGISHAVGHHAPEGDEPHAACELCAAHGMWDHALAVSVAEAPAAPAPPDAPPMAAAGRRYAGLPPFSSRAPPFPV